MVEDQMVSKARNRIKIHHHFSSLQSNDTELLPVSAEGSEELLLVMKIESDKFELRCVPVIIRNLNLFDQFQVVDGKINPLKQSSQVGFKIALEEDNLLSVSQFYIELGMLTRGVFIEPISNSLVCLSVKKNKANKLARIIEDMQDRGVISDYETVNT